jgi:hypothetical protein
LALVLGEDMSQIAVQILDDFLPDPQAFRADALARRYYSIRGPDGEKYPNVHVFPSDEFEPAMSERLGRKVSIDHCFLRLNPSGDNHRIHADIAHSPYAFVLYLNSPEQCRGGTAFWRYRKNGWTSFPEITDVKKATRNAEEILANHQDLTKWEQIHTVDMKPNRMIIYPAKQFHSRWPLEGWGEDPTTSRLVAVGFFNVE